MTDWIYDALLALEALTRDDRSPLDVVLMWVVALTGGFFLVLVHEAGHVLVALATGNRVRELRVGDADGLVVARRGFQLRVGRPWDAAEHGGYTAFDSRTVTPAQEVAIAVAGPAANLLWAILLAALAMRVDGLLAVLLFLWTITNAAVAIHNLIPRGDPAVPEEWNDGRWAQSGWAARRAPH